jgi:hypothetical protein
VERRDRQLGRPGGLLSPVPAYRDPTAADVERAAGVTVWPADHLAASYRDAGIAVCSLCGKLVADRAEHDRSHAVLRGG